MRATLQFAAGLGAVLIALVLVVILLAAATPDTPMPSKLGQGSCFPNCGPETVNGTSIDLGAPR